MFRDHSKRSGEVFQRFEAKYFLHEASAMALVSAIQPYVVSDPFTAWGESYVISSLYMDDPGLSLYQSSVCGEKNRFKLRIRSYSDDPEAPVYLETKRRINKVIQKERVPVKRSSLPSLIEGRGYSTDALLIPDRINLDKLFRFRNLQEAVGAGSCCMVRYLREAYMGAQNEPLRISFDRRLSALALPEYRPDCWEHTSRRYLDVNRAEVILEIKFTDSLPQWTCRIIREFELAQRSMAKYVECVRALSSHGMSIQRDTRKLAGHELF